MCINGFAVCGVKYTLCIAYQRHAFIAQIFHYFRNISHYFLFLPLQAILTPKKLKGSTVGDATLP
jgi:hypothetical protein